MFRQAFPCILSHASSGYLDSLLLYLFHGFAKWVLGSTLYSLRGSILGGVPKMMDLAILWSHNQKNHPGWLDTIMKNCTARFVWWDVAWRCPRVDVPLTGYVWNTVEGQATHKASITKIEGQTSEQLAEEVKRSWRECNIHVNPNSPLLLYQEDRDVKHCTLLKLEDLKRLDHPGKLKDFILAKELRPIKQPPQSCAKVIDPHLS